MSLMIVCDADRKTVVPEGNVVRFGFGIERQYSPEAAPAVEEYIKALQAAAEDARKMYCEARTAAMAVFRERFPNGLLPDVAE